MAKLTASKARTIFTRFKNDNLPRVSDDLFFDFLNDVNIDIYTYWKGINPYDLTSTQNITLSQGTLTYALNSYFESTVGRSLGLFKLNSDGTLGDPIDETSPGSREAGWYIEGSNLRISGGGLNQSSQLRYFATLAEITTTSSEMIIDDDRRFYAPLRNLLNTLYEGWKNNNFDEIRAGTKYLQDVKNLALSLRKQNNRLTYGNTYL